MRPRMLQGRNAPPEAKESIGNTKIFTNPGYLFSGHLRSVTSKGSKVSYKVHNITRFKFNQTV